MRVFTIALAILGTSVLAYADPTVHTFVVWGLKTEMLKPTWDEKFAAWEAPCDRNIGLDFESTVLLGTSG